MNLIMLAVLLSGSCLGVCLLKRRPEDMLPLTQMSIVLILFCFGLFGVLYVGVIVVLGIVMVIYLLCLFLMIKNRNYKASLHKLSTPGCIMFVILFVILSYANYGKQADAWDEFSHWMDCIKAMTYADDFITNPGAHSYFASYPPAMTILQYFFQKIYLFVNPNELFNEWRMYLTYQMFALSMFFPFFKSGKPKGLLNASMMLAILCLLPTLFFGGLYTAVYIDPFIGIVTGCGFAYILYHDRTDYIDEIYIFMLCAVLVLGKDVGLFFSCFISICYGVDVMMEDGKYKTLSCGRVFQKSILLLKASAPLWAILAARLLWRNEMRISGVSPNFGNQINLIEYTSMFFLHKDSTYRQAVVDNMKDAFYGKTIGIGQLNVSISYFGMFILFIVLMYLLYRRALVKKATWIKSSTKVAMVFVLLQLAVYMYCLGATYVSNFGEYEATCLASYERYSNMSYLTVWIVLVIGAIEIWQACDYTERMAAILAAIMLVSPIGQISDFLNRDIARSSQGMRSRYEVLSQQIEKYCSGTDKIYCISEGDQGLDYWVMRYNARPNEFSDNFTWSLGEAQYEGDIWTYNISSDEWHEKLLKEKYTHIALYNVNDYFKDVYSDIFADTENIYSQCLYELNMNTGLFELCE